MSVELVLSEDCKKIRINTEDYDYLRKIRDHFTFYAEGYFHSPKYKCGQWDGTISLFKKGDRSLPFGLFTDIINFHKKWEGSKELIIDPRIKELFNGEKYNTKDLVKCKLWPYREYQEDSIKKAIQYKKSIIRVATAGGKSVIIYGIIQTLFQKGKIGKALIIVPSTSLVDQFYSDLLEYGLEEDRVGKVYSSKKEWDNDIVVSTWQSLSKHLNRLPEFGLVIMDECHGVKGQEVSKILQQSNAEYKTGLTGTLPEIELDYYNVKSYLGPVVVDISVSDLIKWGYISDCKIKQLNIEYNTEFSRDFNQAKDQIFKHPFRYNVVKNIVNGVDGHTLLLVGKVETEGEWLKQKLVEDLWISPEKIIFISGEMKNTLREEWRKKIIDSDQRYIIIATYGVFQQGINIKNLENLIFAAPFKSKIRILQSIGRILRKFDEDKGATVYDIVDWGNKWFPDHSRKREIYYEKEKLEIVKKTLKEP